jgi:flagellar biosynthesis chaperone FliJ
LSGKERKLLVNDLKETRKDLLESIKGLNDAQLNFKASPESWSVKECVYHIALSEGNLWQMAEKALKEPANPEKRSEIKWTDEQVITMIRDRSHKVKTVAPLEPVNAPYKNLDEALDDFKTKRASLIKFAKTSTDDLRNHVVQMPFGYLDCYQLLLMISAHTNRHMQQIQEVMANANFPK